MVAALGLLALGQREGNVAERRGVRRSPAQPLRYLFPLDAEALGMYLLPPPGDPDPVP